MQTPSEGDPWEKIGSGADQWILRPAAAGPGIVAGPPQPGPGPGPDLPAWSCLETLGVLLPEEEWLCLHFQPQARQPWPSGFLKRILPPLINFWHAVLGSSCVSKSS